MLFLAVIAIIIMSIFFYIISRSDSSTPTPPDATQITVSSTPSSTLRPTPTSRVVKTAVSTNVPIEPTVTAVALEATYSPLAPLPTEKRELIFSGNRDKLVVALTFDVGETADDPAGFNRDIIDVLNETETAATFFLGGLWMMNNEAETRELGENPLFELGNHAWSHLDFAQITPEEMSTEILQAQKQMWEYFGWQTGIFRFPFGTYTDESLKLIGDHGLLPIQWDVVSGDPDPNVLAGPMADWVIQQVQPGSIIIMHANGRGWHTAEALPQIIATLEAQGYTFVTISDLLNLEEPQTPLLITE